VDSRDSLENVESKWVGEIADNCQGVKLVLVALKCDLREAGDGDGPEKSVPGGFIQYPEGLAVAERIKVGVNTNLAIWDILTFLCFMTGSSLPW
jgi:Rho family protein